MKPAAPPWPFPKGFPLAEGQPCFANDFLAAVEAIRGGSCAAWHRQWGNGNSFAKALGAKRQWRVDGEGYTLWLWKLPSGDEVIISEDGQEVGDCGRGILQQ